MDRITRAQRSVVMSRIKSGDTLPERTLRSALHRAGLRFRLHAKLPGRPDIVLPKHRVAIFVHGCFWHQHMKCRDGRTPTSNQQYWVPKFRRIAKRDRNAVKNLRKLGWRVVICWECEIRERPKAIMSTIYSRIRFSQSGS